MQEVLCSSSWPVKSLGSIQYMIHGVNPKPDHTPPSFGKIEEAQARTAWCNTQLSRHLTLKPAHFMTKNYAYTYSPSSQQKPFYALGTRRRSVCSCMTCICGVDLIRGREVPTAARPTEVVGKGHQWPTRGVCSKNRSCSSRGYTAVQWEVFNVRLCCRIQGSSAQDIRRKSS